jgi:hypothetical protein
MIPEDFPKIKIPVETVLPEELGEVAVQRLVGRTAASPEVIAAGS